MDYHVVSQGKTTIPGVDDGEELELTDVRYLEPISKLSDAVYHWFETTDHFILLLRPTNRPYS